MSLPAEGVSFKAAHMDYVNALGVFKGTITNILIRDYRGYLTNLRDESMGLAEDGYFSPFTVNGLYRDDLYDPDFPGGTWRNPGLIKDDGFKIASDFDTKDVMTGQMIRPARTDETSQKDEISFTLEEILNEVALALRHNQSLLTVPDIGRPGRVSAAPSEPTRQEYQICALAEDGDKRLAIVLPRVSRKKTGDTVFNRTDDASELPLTYGALVCPFADTPFYIVPEGSGYRALGGSPVFSDTPVATKTGATTATVAFTVPHLLRDPAPDTFTYTVEKKAGAGSFESATIASTSVSGSTVTLSISGLTTATAYVFRVTATAESELATVSSNSNSITTD